MYKRQGQYIDRIVQAGKLEKLEHTIETDEILNKEGNCIEVPDRIRGRKIKYSIGSVVEFESYVLAAFTKFNENNKAYLSAEEYTGFWMRFWENIDEIYAGRTINIPLMGAGIAKMCIRDRGTTPQNFNGKMKRESFTIAELEDIADAVNSSFERKFVLENGEKI